MKSLLKKCRHKTQLFNKPCFCVFLKNHIMLTLFCCKFTCLCGGVLPTHISCLLPCLNAGHCTRGFAQADSNHGVSSSWVLEKQTGRRLAQRLRANVACTTTTTTHLPRICPPSYLTDSEQAERALFRPFCTADGCTTGPPLK